ncbi:unnamed protein product [Hanseniaspora opuntiae]
MKFSHSLQFNAVPEWSNKYINYSQLKKIIYILQQEVLYPNSSYNEFSQPVMSNGLEAQLEDNILPLIKHTSNDTELDLNRQCIEIFTKYLNKELIKCDDFFQMQNSYFTEVLENIINDFNNNDRSKELEERIISSYTQFNELKSYLELNHTGFIKICKKFDKIHHTNLKITYIEGLHMNSVIFNQDSLVHMNESILKTIQLYAALNNISIEETNEKLKVYLKEHLVWERNTIWKDMMNLESKQQTLKKQIPQNLKTNLKIRNATSNNLKSYHSIGANSGDLEENNLIDGTLEIDNESDEINIQYFDDLKKYKFKSVLKYLFLDTPLSLSLIIIAFVYYTSYHVANNYLENNNQTHCLFVLLLASLFWTFEILPLFVTSLLIPFLLTVLPIFRNETTNELLTATESCNYIMSTMWNSVIMLLLGGFTLAASLSKHSIAKILSTFLLSKTSTSPNKILFMNMLIAVFCSMWISNIAAPVLCYSLIQPILRTLPRGSVYAKWLILGIGFASNIGGMSSPISSPQNIIAIGLMNNQPSWFQWFFVVLPVSLVNLRIIYHIIIKFLPLNQTLLGSEENLKLVKIHFNNEKLTLKQWYVVIVSMVTVLLWCFNNQLKQYFGDMGMMSVIPIVAFFGTGILTTQDFNSFMWNIIILTMGGTTLGKAVINTGLLKIFAEYISNKVDGLSLFNVILIFGLIIVTLASFISHTVAAMILAPLMKELGEQLHVSGKRTHGDLLVFITGLLCSAAAALPTSGFPNLCAISMCDDLGEKYLNVREFVKLGLMITISGYIVVITLGYLLMRVLGY